MTNTPTPVVPVTMEDTPAPLDPVIIEMLDKHLNVAVWPYVDSEKTKLKFEEAKKVSPNGYHNWNNYRAYTRSTTELAAAKALRNNLNPQDAIEAMLISQITAVHFASIECLDHASWEVDNVENRVSYLNTVSKLNRSFIGLVDALNHHRGKGSSQQTITVVHVNDGGQAIVGNVASQGRGGRKN